MGSAGDTIGVRFDDVLAIQSPTQSGTTVPWANRFTSTSASPRVTSAIQFGVLSARDPSDYGQVAHGYYGRISPRFAKPSLGLDFATGVLFGDEGDGVGADFSLALCGTLPIGERLGVAPHGGVAILLGSGGGIWSRTLGTAVYVRLSRGFGLRTDITYHWFSCEGCNFEALSSLLVGPYFGF
jgi:hypothetical protein